MVIMDSRKIKLFTIGYPDNTETNHLLNYFIQNGINIDGVLFAKSQIKRDWKRLIKKIHMRGYFPALKRICENLIVRKKQISKLCHQNIDKLFFVDEINSEEVRDILISKKVELLILTTVYIIKPIIIDIDGLTILNAHTGWLPKYRGLDCNLKALRDGHQLGLSVHKVTKKIDAGEIYLRKSFQIDTDGDILKQMDEKELQLSGKLFAEAVNLISRNILKPIAQNEPLGKYEPPLTKQQRNEILRNIKGR
jgi:methionyl-tRNA formyltransferase